MTVFGVDAVAEAAVTQARAFAELIVSVLLVAILLEREMVRHASSTWVVATGPVLLAIAAPIGVGWVVITVHRVMSLLSP